MAWLALVVIARIAEARRYLEVDDDAMKDEGHHPAVIGRLTCQPLTNNGI